APSCVCAGPPECCRPSNLLIRTSELFLTEFPGSITSEAGHYVATGLTVVAIIRIKCCGSVTEAENRSEPANLQRNRHKILSFWILRLYIFNPNQEHGR